MVGLTKYGACVTSNSLCQNGSHFIALILTLVYIHIDPSPVTAGRPSWLLGVIGGVSGCVILIVIIAVACCIKRRKTSTIKRGKGVSQICCELLSHICLSPGAIKEHCV